jgi:uncharacterized membrane protein YeaQ/YmgE (transglycosylase-associated protein family)
MLTWIVVILAGAFIGWIASKLMGTDASMGALANIVCGLIGAVIGRFVSDLLFGARYGTDFSLPGLLFGVIGACILIAIVKAITGGGRRSVLH